MAPANPDLDERARARLLDEAAAATDLAYSPYSSTRIGAALLTRSGRVYRGGNVGNACSALNCCAEQVALVQMVAAGEREPVAIAVVQRGEDSTVPCGRCLQLLAEFAEDLTVLSRGPEGPVAWRLKELLPLPFRRARAE